MPNDVFSQRASHPPPQLNPPLKAGLSEAPLIAVVRSLNLNVKTQTVVYPPLHCAIVCGGRNRIPQDLFILGREGFFFCVSSPERGILLRPLQHFLFQCSGHQDLKSNSHLFIEHGSAKSPTHSAAPPPRLSPHSPSAASPPAASRPAGRQGSQAG